MTLVPHINVKVLENHGDCLSLLDEWKKKRLVILIDAMHSGAPPGTIQRFELPSNESLPQRFHCLSHSAGIVEIMALGEALYQLPRRLILVGIEAARFAEGSPLTPDVAQAATMVAWEVLDELAANV